MKNMKKIMMTIIALCMATCSLWAQNEVSLVVSGEGKDKEDATLKALRSAIEQAYGTFVSANTTVLNDQLVADEIVSLSSGNIQKYEYVSETKMPDGSTFVTLSTTVSIDKLVAFAESKGMEAELKGGLFAMNIKKMEFEKQAEEKVVTNLCKQLEAMLPTLFDYEIEVEEPTQASGDKYSVAFSVTAKPNRNNMDQFIKTLYTTLGKISLSKEEIKNYEDINRQYYTIMFYDIAGSLVGDYGRNVHPIGIETIGGRVFSKNRKRLPPPTICSDCWDYVPKLSHDWAGYRFGKHGESIEFDQVSDAERSLFINRLENLGVPYSECYSIEDCDGTESGMSRCKYVIKTFINPCLLRSSTSYHLLNRFAEVATNNLYTVKISDNIRQHIISGSSSGYNDYKVLEWHRRDNGWPPYDRYIKGHAPYGNNHISGKLFYTLEEISKVNNITVSKPTFEELQSQNRNNRYSY